MPLRRFALRVLSVFRYGRAEAELAREINSHLQMLEDDFVVRGMRREEARFAARRAFRGQVEQTKEHHRDARSFRVLDQSWLDFKLGMRMLVRYPGLTVVSVLGISVAIAAAVGAFTIVDVLLHPTVPLPEGDRIVAIQNWDVAKRDREPRSLHDFVTWRERMTSIRELGAFRQVARNLIASGVGPEIVSVAEMTASAFRATRVTPLLGRYLLEEDERPGAAPVVVIGHSPWTRRFASDPDIVGRQLQLGATTYTIVGVMPEGYSFPHSEAFWVPFIADPMRYPRRQGPDLMVFGRLADGATLESAQAELTALGQQTAASFPATHEQLRPQVVHYTYPFSDMDDPMNALTLQIIRYLVSLLLAIVCVNVASLVYARSVTRQGEIAVRTALGASRRRVVGQLFIEALALAGIAAGAGLLVIVSALEWLNAAIVQLMGPLPFWMSLQLSPGAIGYLIALTIVAAGIVGIVPALRVTGRQVQDRLKTSSAGMRLGTTWTVLIVAQVAIAVALLPTAVYHVWDAATYGTDALEFPADEVLSAYIVLDRGALANQDAAATAEEFNARFANRQLELARRIAAEPSVASVSLSMLSVDQEVRASIEVEGIETPGAADYHAAVGRATGHPVRFNRVAVDWFGTLGVPLLASRTFSNAEAVPAATSVVVNRDFVRYVLGNEPALGRRFRYLGVRRDPIAVALNQWYDIVGVVENLPVHASDPQLADPKVYHPMAPGAYHPAVVAIRMRDADPWAFAPRLREIGAAVDPDLQLRRVFRLDEELRQDAALFRLVASALVLMTLSVVALSAAGIYALMSCTVEQRRKEIGIRAALGANPRRILGAIFARAFAQLALGGGLGLGVAVLVDIASEGETLNGTGGFVLPLVVMLMLAVGMTAALRPARRGLRINVTEVLRDQ